MGDLGGLTSQLTSSSSRRDVKLGVSCLDAACTVGLNQLLVAGNPGKPNQNRLKGKASDPRQLEILSAAVKFMEANSP